MFWFSVPTPFTNKPKSSVGSLYHLSIGLVVTIVPNYLCSAWYVGVGGTSPPARYVLQQVEDFSCKKGEEGQFCPRPLNLLSLPLVNTHIGVMLGIVGMNLGGHYCTGLGKDS